MSVSRVVLPVLDLEQNDKPIIKQVVKGCKHFTEQKINPDSSSQSSCSFSFSPPSQNTVIDRCILLRCSVVLTSAGMDEAQGAVGGVRTSKNVFFDNVSALAIQDLPGNQVTVENLQSGAFARVGNNLSPKQFPLTRLMDSIDITLNGTHFTASVNQYINAVMRYTTPEYRERVFSNTAHRPDKKPYNETSGLSDHPMAKSGQVAGESPRGYGIGVGSIVTRSATKLHQIFEEPLMLSPLMSHHGLGMTNINDIQVTINWKSDKKSAFSLLATGANDANDGVTYVSQGLTARATPQNLAAFTGASVARNANDTADEDPQLVVRYYTPQDDIKIPNEIVLPYKQPKIVIQGDGGTAFGTTPANATLVTGNNIRLNQIPECVYLYCKMRRSGESMLQPDLYSTPTKIAINFNNQSGLLTGLDEKALLKLAQENGCEVDAHEATRGGYPLKLCFGKDIPLPDNVSAGSRGDYSFQVDYTSYNTFSAQRNEFYQVFVYQGQAVVSPNECRVQTGLLSLEDNVNAEDMGNELHQHSSMEGGSSVGGSIVGGSLVGDMTKHMVKHMAGKNKMLQALAEPAGKLADKAFEKYKTRK